MSFAAIGVAALTWLASPVVKDLYDKSKAFLGNDIAEDLDDLETTLIPEFQLTIQAAQNSPHKDKLNKWLLRLKNAYYDAEAILHEVEYESLRRKVKADQKTPRKVRISSHPMIKPLAKFVIKLKKKASPLTKPLAKFSGKLTEKVSLLSLRKRKLLNRLNKLKKVAAKAKRFRELLQIGGPENGNSTTPDSNPPMTTITPPPKVFGRDGDRKKIINFLSGNDGKGGSHSSSAARSYPVVAITGVGGAGKTTLAQYVCDDKSVKERFSVRMWVCLSQNKDDTERTKEMVECITKRRPDLTNLTELRNILKNALASEPKGVLLVLDNFWPSDTKSTEEDKQWDDLLAPFNCVRAKFKIIITSRSDKFPVPLLPAEHIKLSELADADFQSLFRYSTGLDISGPELQTVYYTIANEIAKKLIKFPLAARVVGDQLYKNRDINFWKGILRNVDLSDMMEVLLWSYKRMNVQLQRCFLFFGSFTRGTCFTKSNLVQYWVALDFVQPLDDRISVEDVGFGYIDLMLANSIIVERVNGYYTIHELFHELAENLSARDCFRVTDSETVIPSTTVLHVSLSVSKENLKEKLSSISNLCNLRTLFLETRFIDDVKGTFSMISTTFKHLRVLEMWTGDYNTLPETVGDLRNLRYLDVYRSSIKELPDSMSRLYHLQYLLLPEYVKTLPVTLRNLTKLRSIGMYEKKFIHVNALPPVPYLGRLTSLQNLPEFHVRREEGYELQQLGHLREIGGSLRIVGLENVRDKDKALAARLIDKAELKEIKLVWTGSVESIASEVDVIEALQPPKNLERLNIDGYRGSICPTWLEEGSTLLYLQSVGFHNCNALKALPSSFGQFHHCRELSLYNLGAMRELPAFPVNLAELSISTCPSLTLLHENELPLQVEDLQGRVVSGFLPSVGYHWTCVLETEVQSFERISSVKNCQEQLQIIKSAINGNNIPSEKWEDVVGRAWCTCHQQRMNFISDGIARPNKLELPVKLCILELSYCCISDGALSDGLRDMASLQKLKLEGIMTITTLPPIDVLQTLKSLQVLEIYHCWCLRSLGGLHALPSLQELDVEGCWSLEMKNDDRALLPPTLQSVIIKGSIISNNILCGKFQYLHEIIIHDCKVPDSLSFHHLNSLHILRISYCSSLRLVKLSAVIDSLELVKLPKLDVQSVLNSWRGYRRLQISNSLMLNKLLLSQNFVGPKFLFLIDCEEETISFEKSVHLQSIKELGFFECKTKNLPATLRDFSDLEHIIFEDCPEISELPELPGSVHWIKITNCPVLRERCQPNGPDWHKIQHIKNKLID